MEQTVDKTSKKKRNKKEPLLHIVKKPKAPIWQTIIVNAIALILAFLISGIFLMLTTNNNINLGTFFSSLFTSSFKNTAKIFQFFKNYVILLGFAIALIPAFKMKFWNVGADGQALFGALMSYLVAYSLQKYVPNGLLVFICIVVAVLAGALFGVIPAIFKAFFNTNETLFTLMLNYVAVQLVLIAAAVIGYANNGNLFQLEGGIIEQLAGPSRSKISLFAIISVITLFIIVTIYLLKTKPGFELSIVGESINTAKYIGISVKKAIIKNMAISGGICGFVGFLIVHTTGSNVLTSTSIGGLGFVAIIVVWLAKFNPFYTLLTTFLVVFLRNGCSDLNLTTNSAPNAVTSIFFFFIIAFGFFLSYRFVARRNEQGEIDNKFIKFIANILDKITKFFDKLSDKISKTLNIRRRHQTITDSNDVIENLPKEADASLDINEKSVDAEIGTNDEITSYSNIDLTDVEAKEDIDNKEEANVDSKKEVDE